MSILSNSCNLPLLIVTIVADLIAVIAFVFKSGSWSIKEKLTAVILFFVISAMLYYVSFLPAITSAQQHLQAPGNSAGASAITVTAPPTKQPEIVYEATAVPTQTATLEASVTAAPAKPISGTYDKGVEEPNSYKQGIALFDKQKYETALPFLMEAAERNYAPAQYLLGECYRVGYGVNVDEEAAFQWYKLAADQYYANGLIWVGYCYHHGIGVAQDYTLAGEYYVAAKNAGHKNADDRIGELLLDMADF